MLTYLKITNFTIIDQLQLELANGMSVITGETGAGKSIIVDALSLLLGERARTELIRHNTEQCDISGIFQLEKNSPVHAWLTEHELSDPDQPQQCVLRRLLNQDGRSRAFINGHVVPVQLLKNFGALQVEIHSQHAAQALFKRETQREILDAFAGEQALARQVRAAYLAWQQIQKQLQALQAQSDQQTRVDFLQFQLEELNKLALMANEVDELHAEHKVLAQAQDTLDEVHVALAVLRDNEDNLTAQLQHALSLLKKPSAQHRPVQEALQLLEQADIQCQEAAQTLDGFLGDFKQDPERLHFIEQRLQAIHDVARKHRVDATQLADLQNQLQDELNILLGAEQRIVELNQQLSEQALHYQTLAEKLSKKRKTAANKLSQQVTQNLQALGLPHGQFHINFTAHEQMHAAGLESIEFMLNTNPGQTPGPLNKIASGGELSRVSLALQVIIAKHYQTPLLIFDEVDVGIGGATAEIVGQLLRQLGQQGQVFCITHLAQVAAQGNQHLRVEKSTDGKHTQTQIIYLDEAQRIQELARMLGGQQISKQTLAHAQEMLESV